MISAFGIEHSVSKTLLGGGVYKPATQLTRGERVIARNAKLYRKPGPDAPLKPVNMPTTAFHPQHGKMRVLGYHQKTKKFIMLDKTDTRRIMGRNEVRFGKNMPKKVPDQISAVLPGSTVRAYDYSGKHKVRAASGNVGAKATGAALGGAVGVGLAALAGKRLKPLQSATKVSVGGMKVGAKQVIKPRRLTLTRDMKRGWAQSSIVGATAGAGGGYAGNKQLKHVQVNPKYRYGR